jgi:tripartite ATP-independent transporter DctP family solute receptor
MVAHVIVILLMLASSQVMFTEDAQGATAKLGHLHPQNAPIAQFMIQFADQVRKSSGGQLTITVYPDGQLGSATDLLNRLRKRDVELALIPPEVLSTIVPEFQLFRLPYLFKNYAHVDGMLDGDFGRSLLLTSQNANIVGLGFFDQGFIDFAGDRTIRTPDDFKGLRVRVPPDEIRMASLRAVGANPTPIAFAEVYTALQQRVVDGAETSIQFAAMAKLQETVKSISLTNAYYSAEILVASGDWYIHSLDPQLRKIVEAEVQQIVRTFREARRKQDQEVLNRFAQSGVVLVRDVDAPAFQRAVKSVYDAEPIASIVKMLRQLKCPKGCPLPPICCSK